jgi:hypothetical protein
MKELRDLDKSASVKDKVFTVSLVNDNLFEVSMPHAASTGTLIRTAVGRPTI